MWSYYWLCCSVAVSVPALMIISAAIGTFAVRQLTDLVEYIERRLRGRGS